LIPSETEALGVLESGLGSGRAAMILAAGRGERMGSLTRRRPKPLLEVGGRTLIEHQIQRLRRAGYHQLVVNLGYLGHLIELRLGDGAAYGVHIRYTREGDDILGTGGGVRNALSWLGDGPILVVNADIWTRFPYASLGRCPRAGAHLVLVPNPPHHLEGDFALDPPRVRPAGSGPTATFSGIGLYDPWLFAGMPGGPFPLIAALEEAMIAGRVTGELFEGKWVDVGTPARLSRLDLELLAGSETTGFPGKRLANQPARFM